MVARSTSLLLLGWLAVSLPAAELKPETTAAWDHYIKLTEANLEKRWRTSDFLWLDQHRKEKSLVWMGQYFDAPRKTLDSGQEIEVPDGQIQDWYSNVFITGVKLEKVRDTILDYADYKYFFKPEIVESKLVKREGDHFDVSLRIAKRQLGNIVLNTTYSVDYKALDATHVAIVCHSTHIGEAKHSKAHGYDEEQPADKDVGFLWRLNSYWRLEEADNGVFIELEQVSLSRPPGLLPTRYLNSFVQTFPKEFASRLTQGLYHAISGH